MFNVFSLPQAGKDHISVLDGWRGTAISLVLINHFFNVKALHLGSMGVNLFFALSGVLMAQILFIKRQPLTLFYKRRVSRILPVFFMFVSVIYLFGYLNGIEESKHYIATLFFLRSYVGDVGIWGADLPIGHLWSLNIEEHAYIVLSLMTLFIKDKRVAGVLLIFIGTSSIAVSLYYELNRADLINDLTSLRQRTEANLAYLMIAGAYAINKPTLSRRYSYLPAFALIAGIFCYTDYAPWFSRTVFPPFLFAFTVAHLNEATHALKSFFNLKVLRLLGMWSFSLYLWQQPFYLYVKSHDYPVSMSCAGVLISLVVAIASFHLIESPARGFINQLRIKHWERVTN
ncbi:MAG: hypothetical protein CBC55_01530 [Gammaproteobacteria bacterium TMED95]|nr:MAG: hypothetical protein CBC55_01530 [Gammaproteobacteria bacterium TMED95]|tara:strand:- start:129 stop:1160 length:1032 start_codon:yes stop_codon:yes gene_type:complete